MSSYLKFAAQVAATILAAVALAFGDGQVSSSEWINVIVLGLGSVAVLGAGNLPAGVWAHTKLIVSAATAGAVFLQSAITDGIDGSEWLQLALAVLAALGVFAVKGPVVYGDALAAGRNQAGLRNGPAV